MAAKDVFDLKVAVQRYTVTGAEFVEGLGWVINLPLVPPQPSRVLIAKAGAVVPDTDYTLAGAQLTYTKLDAPLAAGDELVVIHDNALFAGFKALMESAKASAENPRGEDASFIDVTIEFHAWLKATVDDAFADLDTRIAAIVAAHNGHSHSHTDNSFDGSAAFATTGTTSGPSLTVAS